MTTLQEAAQAAMKYIRSTADYKAGHPVAIEAAEDLSDALAQQGEPVAYEVDATKFANGKQLTYDKPENLPSYLTYRPLYAGTQAQQIQEPETAMIDAAMVEMANITPPLRRSECKRLIRAALSAAPASQAQKPAAYITDTHQGPMVWTQEMYDEACTYCDDGEFPVPLYTAAPAPQAQEPCPNGEPCKHGHWCTDVYCQGIPVFRDLYKAAPAQPDWLLKTTQDLAKAIARDNYPEVPQFEVLDDLAGVISQIDNMVTGMERKSAHGIREVK